MKCFGLRRVLHELRSNLAGTLLQMTSSCRHRSTWLSGVRLPGYPAPPGSFGPARRLRNSPRPRFPAIPGGDVAKNRGRRLFANLVGNGCLAVGGACEGERRNDYRSAFWGVRNGDVDQASAEEGRVGKGGTHFKRLAVLIWVDNNKREIGRASCRERV